MRLRCAIERGSARQAVLDEAGVSAVQWSALQRRWLRAMAAEAERGGGELTRRYVAAFAEVAPSLAPAIPQAAVLPATAPMATPVPVAGAAAFVRPPIMTPRMEALPLGPDVTVVGDVPIFEEPLPFRDTIAKPSSAAEAVALEARDMVGETSVFDALTDEELAAPLPFSARNAPHSQDFEQSVDETAFMSALVFDDDALPFEASDDGSAPVALVHEAHDMAGETGIIAALTDEDLGLLPFGQGAASEAEPVRQPAPMVSSELSIEQYASLRAELDRVQGADRSSLLSRYGLHSEDAFVELKRRWSDRFRDMPADYGHFRAAYDTYSQWLGQRL